MKRKLTSILLALVLCLPLAASTLASGAVEPPVPEETAAPAPEGQTGTLPVEVETPADVVAAPEELPEDVIDPEEAIPHGVTRVYREDGTLWCVVDPSLTSASLADRDVEAYEEIFQFMRQMMSENFEVASEPYDLSPLAGGTDASIRPPVKDHPHEVEIMNRDTYYQHDQTQHQLVYGLYVECADPDCGFSAYFVEPQPSEPHTWTQTSIEYINQGNDHKTERHYTCHVCGATDTKTESEEHEMERTDFGRNYHEGLLHYIEWFLACKKCDHTATEWQSFTCPGSPGGNGCQIPIGKVDPPVETQDVILPEETE